MHQGCQSVGLVHHWSGDCSPSGAFKIKRRQTIFFKAPLTGVHDPQLLPNITEVAQAMLAELDNNEGRTLGSTGITTPTESPAPPSWPACSPTSGRRLRFKIHVPDRMTEGYGISVAKLEQIAAAGDRMVVSVDCGITALEAANEPKSWDSLF